MQFRRHKTVKTKQEKVKIFPEHYSSVENSLDIWILCVKFLLRCCLPEFKCF